MRNFTCFALIGLLLIFQYQLPLRVSRDARPPRLEALLTRVEPWEGMGFGIQHDLVKRQDVIRAEEEVEVLERLGLFVSESILFYVGNPDLPAKNSPCCLCSGAALWSRR
jgi:hypothetical protein